MKSGEREELFEFLENLKHKTVIVEGKRDKQALCSFGFTKVIAINGKNLYEIWQLCREAVVLTDFDSAGEELAKKLSLFLRSDAHTRKKLRQFFIKNKIFAIESLKKLANEYE